MKIHNYFRLFVIYLIYFGIASQNSLYAMDDILGENYKRVKAVAQAVDKVVGVPDEDRIMTETQPSIVQYSSFQERYNNRSTIDHGINHAKENPLDTLVTVGAIFYCGYQAYKWFYPDKEEAKTNE